MPSKTRVESAKGHKKRGRKAGTDDDDYDQEAMEREEGDEEDDEFCTGDNLPSCLCNLASRSKTFPMLQAQDAHSIPRPLCRLLLVQRMPTVQGARERESLELLQQPEPTPASSQTSCKLSLRPIGRRTHRHRKS